MKYRTVPPAKVYLTRGLHRPEKGGRCQITFRENPLRGKRIMEKGQYDGRKLPVKGIPSASALNAL